MKYEIPNEASGYLPEVFSLLKSLDDEHVYGHEHQLSHPADIFILTFRDAIECIKNLAKSVNEATETTARGEKLKDGLLAEIRHQIFDLLFYMGNFVEGCQSIIKSLFPRGDKRLSKVARVFKENVEDYTSHASQIINKIKHQHRRPRVFTFTYDNKIIVGYYLENLVAEGVLGPDPELHKSFKNLRTAFSLNRAIPYHLCNLYYVSACLASVIKAHGHAGMHSEAGVNDDLFREVFSESAQIPCILLPDEIEKPLPVVARKDKENYLLEFPGKKEILNRRVHLANVEVEARMGVRDRGIAPPYMQTAK